MEVYILRHGEAGNPLSYAARDQRRSLTESGREEVRRVAKALPRIGVKPDRVISSPLKRAAETAEIAAEEVGLRNKVEFWDELKPEGDRRKLYSRLATLGPETEVLLVGHEPFLTAMVSELVGTPGSRIVLKKAGLARVTVRSSAGTLKGELRWLLSPKVLKAL